MTDRELMQMALDALEEAKENVMDWGSYASEYFKTKHGLAQDILAIENISEALRARLAQPEPEPVAWMHDSHVGFNVPLYTASPQREWQTLTENEIKHLWYEACQTNLELTSQLIVHLARNIEAKLKEKNNA